MGGKFLGCQRNAADERINRKIEEIIKKRETSMGLVAMAWSLNKPYVMQSIIGMRKIERGNEAVKAIDFILSKEVESIDKLYELKNVNGITLQRKGQECFGNRLLYIIPK